MNIIILGLSLLLIGIILAEKGVFDSLGTFNSLSIIVIAVIAGLCIVQLIKLMKEDSVE